MTIRLSDHFTFPRLFRFTFPSVVMMLFTSIYGVVDGFFVSNYVGKTPFAAVNMVWPFLMICGAFGFMLGTGGSALVAKTFGEGKDKEARELFSLLVYVSVGIGAVIVTLGLIFLRPIMAFLGAEGELLDYCVIYGRILLLSLIPYLLQNEFQSFLVTAEKPGLGLAVTVAAGVTNMALDFLLVGVFDFGLVGAAAATAVSQSVGGLFPLIYFFCRNKSRLRLGRTKWRGMALLRACANGSSEFVVNISLSVIGMLYNVRLLDLAGEDGVAAYGVVMYVSFIFIAVFLGYTIGVSPLVSYHFGADNTEELQNLFRKSILIVGSLSVVLTVIGEFCASLFAGLFVGYEEGLLDMTIRAFVVYSFSYLFVGFNIFGSSFFTALNDGFVSASISFLRTLVFQVICVLLLPALLPPAYRLDGIWAANPAAEAISIIVSITFFAAKRKKYHYA